MVLLVDPQEPWCPTGRLVERLINRPILEHHPLGSMANRQLDSKVMGSNLLPQSKQPQRRSLQWRRRLRRH